MRHGMIERAPQEGLQISAGSWHPRLHDVTI
jgi:hypothetical protein